MMTLDAALKALRKEPGHDWQACRRDATGQIVQVSFLGAYRREVDFLRENVEGLRVEEVQENLSNGFLRVNVGIG